MDEAATQAPHPLRRVGFAMPGFEQAPIQWTREFWNTRRLLRALWMAVCILSLVALVVVTSLVSSGRLVVSAEPHFVAFICSTIFTCLTVPISLYGVHMHLVHNSKPHIQRHIVRVLFMVPIYGFNAWLALLFGLLCMGDVWILIPDTIRSIYEAYTIYSFYHFVEEYIKDREARSTVDVLRSKAPMKHMFPLRLALWTPQRGWFEVYSVPPWQMGVDFKNKCEYGVKNYVCAKPLTAIIAFVCVLTNTYGEGQFRPDVAYPYLTLIDNFSQLWAMYCLILVYLNLHDEIASCRPTMKFICVKGVVFATFWQSTILSLLVFTGTLSGLNDGWNWKCHVQSNQVVSALQNFLISVEMLVFAVLHAYAFPSREYRDARLQPRRAAARLKHLFDVRDVYDDVSRHAETVAGQVAGGVTAVAGSVAGGVAGGVTAVADQVLRAGKCGRLGPLNGTLSCWSRSLSVDGGTSPLLLDAEDLFDESELDDDAAWLRIPDLPTSSAARPLLDIDAAASLTNTASSSAAQQGDL